MIGAVGAVRLHAVGDAGHGVAYKGGAAVGEGEEPVLESCKDGGEGVFLVGPEAAACLPCVRSVDQSLAVIGHQPCQGDQRQSGGEFLLDPAQALGVEGFHREGLFDGLVELFD